MKLARELVNRRARTARTVANPLEVPTCRKGAPRPRDDDRANARIQSEVRELVGQSSRELDVHGVQYFRPGERDLRDTFRSAGSKRARHQSHVAPQSRQKATSPF